MTKRIMIDVLALGMGVTGALMIYQYFAAPARLHVVLAFAIVNLASAAFLASVVRPMMQGRLGTVKWLMNGSLVVLLGSWSAVFWLEFFSPLRQPSSLSGAVTWSLAAIVCVVDLVLGSLRKAPVPAAHAAPAATAK